MFLPLQEQVAAACTENRADQQSRKIENLKSFSMSKFEYPLDESPAFTRFLTNERKAEEIYLQRISNEPFVSEFSEEEIKFLEELEVSKERQFLPLVPEFSSPNRRKRSVSLFYISSAQTVVSLAFMFIFCNRLVSSTLVFVFAINNDQSYLCH
jgi:hypothetical protein